MIRLAGEEIRIPRPVPNQTDHSNCSRGSSNYVGARTSCKHAACTCSVAHTTCSGGRHTCSDEPRICRVALHSSGYVLAPAVLTDALAVQAFAPAMRPNPFASDHPLGTSSGAFQILSWTLPLWKSGFPDRPDRFTYHPGRFNYRPGHSSYRPERFRYGNLDSPTELVCLGHLTAWFCSCVSFCVTCGVPRPQHRSSLLRWKNESYFQTRPLAQDAAKLAM